MRQITWTVAAALLALAALAACGADSGRAAAAEEKAMTETGTETGSGGARYTKPGDDELRQRLNPMQYKVTQHEGTEPPFQNEYWDHKGEGIYVDVVSGEPLFSSREKYDSGTGWPSFWAPLAEENIVEREDRRLFSRRTEIRSKNGDSHLGHVFPDGPAPTGQRYCMNSAALRFVPVEKLEDEGYGEYVEHFRGDGGEAP